MQISKAVFLAEFLEFGKLAMEGLWNGVDFKLCASDYIGFKPFKVLE